MQGCHACKTAQFWKSDFFDLRQFITNVLQLQDGFFTKLTQIFYAKRQHIFHIKQICHYEGGHPPP